MTQSIEDRVKQLELAVKVLELATIKLFEQDESTFSTVREAIDGIMVVLKQQGNTISTLTDQHNKWLRGAGVATFEEFLKQSVEKASQ